MLKIKEIKQNIYEDFEGIFFCKCLNKEIEIVYSKELSSEYLNKAIEHFNFIYPKILNNACKYTVDYCKDTMREYPDVNYNEGLYNLKNDLDILNYIDIYSLKVQFHNGDIVINLSAGCEWTEEEALQWIIQGDNIIYVGPWYNFNAWSSKLSDPMFNYCVK